MRHLTLWVLAAATVAPLAAQPNPFRPVTLGIRGAQVSYSLTGDVAGTATLAMDPERTTRRQTSTMKMMGKSVSTDSWVLTTEDSTYTADLTKKEGTVAPNMVPLMARAYDHLDNPGKKRLHDNLKDMAGVLSRGFGLGNLAEAGEKTGKKTYAGQECEERQFGGFTICAMAKAPISLHTQGSLVCVSFKETATAVALTAPGGDAFAKPVGVTWSPNRYLKNADSIATGYVLYLSSQQLADSLARAKTQMAQTPAATGTTATTTQTPEQQAAMQQACDALKNFDMGKAMADATSQMGKEIADALKRAAIDAAKNSATRGLKGIFKPRIP